MEGGSSGSPIILLNDNSNDIPVIGIHIGWNKKKMINFGRNILFFQKKNR